MTDNSPKIDELTSSESGNLHSDLGIAADQLKIATTSLEQWKNRTYSTEDRQYLVQRLEDAQACLGEAMRLITSRTVQEFEKQLGVNDCPACRGSGEKDGKSCPKCFGTGTYYPN